MKMYYNKHSWCIFLTDYYEVLTLRILKSINKQIIKLTFLLATKCVLKFTKQIRIFILIFIDFYPETVFRHLIWSNLQWKKSDS